MPSPTVQTAISCTRCGKPLPAFARFCKRCGMAMFTAAPPLPIYTPPWSAPPPLPPDPVLTPPQPHPAARPRKQEGGCLGMIILIAAIAGGSAMYRQYKPRSAVRPISVPSFQPPKFETKPLIMDPAELTNGNALFRDKKYDSAISTYSTGLRKHPGHRGLLAARANAYLWKDDRNNALADYRTLFNSNASDYPTRHLRNRMEILAGDRRAALRDAQYVAQQRPTDATSLMLRGQAELWNDNSNAAQATFAKAIAMDSRLPETVRQQGQRYFDFGLYTQANYDFICLVWMQPNKAAAWYGLARCRAALGQNDLAIEAYQRYLQYDQTSQQADYARREIKRMRGW